MGVQVRPLAIEVAHGRDSAFQMDDRKANLGAFDGPSDEESIILLVFDQEDGPLGWQGGWQSGGKIGWGAVTFYGLNTYVLLALAHDNWRLVLDNGR